MKLVRLKILSDFRGLKNGFEIIFDKQTPKNENINIEPICFIGLNGSGKSNILEVLSEIFYYLENYSNVDEKKKKDFKTSFGFEIEYILPQNTYNKKLSANQKAAKNDVHIKISKLPKMYPEAIAISIDPAIKYKNPEEFRSFLPSYIIGYSSGMNELISNPYIKMDFKYIQEFTKLSNNNSVGSLDVNRLFFMDYDLNKLITICNFLFDEKIDKSDLGIKNIQPIKEKIGIQDLFSFTIELRLRRDDKNPVKLPSQLNLAVDKLKQCATLTYKSQGKTAKYGEYEEYTFSFWVNKETKRAFKHHFGSAYKLFNDLYFLRLLNNYLIGGDTQSKVLKADLGTNISAMLPKYEANKRLFYIADLAFKKRYAKKPVYYNQLSDGEHQFLHVVGALILLDNEGALFLLDEPETHFNPEWRSQFVSILNECMKVDNSKREQEIILTTHSPFIVSDCKKEKVFIFRRKDKKNKVQSPYNPKNETYGRSIEMIYWEIFKKHETISQMAFNELEEIKEKIINKQISKKDAAKELLKFGNSMERMSITKLLMDREDKK